MNLDMRNKIRTLFMAALGLVMSAQMTFSASPAASGGNTVISYLPYTITAPGTYVLKANLSYPSDGNVPPAITVGPNLTGPVTLDLKNFSLIGSGLYIGSVTGIVVPRGNQFTITVQNGTVTKFDCGISATDAGNLTLKNINFTSNTEGLVFTRVGGATVTNCAFVGPAPDCNGIIDSGSDGAVNLYDSVTFSKIDHPLIVGGTQDDGAFTLNFKATPVKATK
jgi:hypothetical protein